jgi:hypothetical protein
MRNLLAVLVLSGLALAGCAADPVGDPGAEAQTSDYGFTKDLAGKPIATDVESVGPFSPQNSFDRTAEQIVADEAAAASCSGACNANVCVCSGDFDCCIIGCVICWEVLET